eukprot:TRINITY_DN39842_c0_g1_i1.p1 TRINITY_DN39842_c0_g1~~TRINITY_DN39842_c0_g1_i1.p1  ORF type:complete len:249 (+),score=30.16 TRINITY_DN39842_c0_g1_i1:47-793(+)
MGVMLPVVAQMLRWVYIGVTCVVAFWFILINFLGDERTHPLDYYSNKLRTRPYLFAAEILFLAASMGILIASGQLQLFEQALPEVAIAVQAQGLVIAVNVLLKVSSAASLTSVGFYIFTGAISVVIIISASLPIKRQGVVFSSVYIVLNVVFVVWLGNGVKRHLGHDKGEALVPEGAEVMPRVWSSTVKTSAPSLLVLTNILYLSEYLFTQGRYGQVGAVLYTFVSCLLIAGCCHEFRGENTTTAVEA